MPRIILADNLDALRGLPDGQADLIYIDPPFNTGRTQRRTRIRTRRSSPGEEGDRTGFQGERYETTVLGSRRFADRFDDYLGSSGPGSSKRIVPSLRTDPSTSTSTTGKCTTAGSSWTTCSAPATS